MNPCIANIDELLELIPIFYNCSFKNGIKYVNHLLHVK